MDRGESGCMFQVRPLKGNMSLGYLDQAAPGWQRSQSLLCCISNGGMHRDWSTSNAVKKELCWVLAMGAPVCSRSCIWELQPAPDHLHQLRLHAAILGHQGCRSSTSPSPPASDFCLQGYSIALVEQREDCGGLHRAGLFLSIQKSK